MNKGVLQTAEEVLGRLLIDNLAVGFSRMTQDYSNHMRPPPATLFVDYRRASAEVDLSFSIMESFP